MRSLTAVFQNKNNSTIWKQPTDKKHEKKTPTVLSNN